jgi:hypothetical protein
MTDQDDGQPSTEHNVASTEHEEIIDAEVVEVSELEPIEADENPPGNEDKRVRHLPAVRRDTGTRDWSDYAEPQRQCRAHKKTGERCKNAAILGSTVCRYHGGAAEHVKRAARARIENATDLVAKELIVIALSGDSDATRVTAIKDLLDRGGLKAPSEVVLSPGERKPYEVIFEDISSGSRAESRARRGLNPVEDSGLDRSANGLDVSLDNYADTDLDDVEHANQSYCDTGGYDGSLYTADGRLSGPETRGFDRPEPSPGPRGNASQMAAEDAVAVANRANARVGALRAIESPHKRYLRP